MKQYTYYVLKHYRNNVKREGYSNNVYIAHLGSRVEGVNGSMRLAASPLQFIIWVIFSVRIKPFASIRYPRVATSESILCSRNSIQVLLTTTLYHLHFEMVALFKLQNNKGLSIEIWDMPNWDSSCEEWMLSLFWWLFVLWNQFFK